MNTKAQAMSVWMATTPTTAYPSLHQDLSVDTVVIGGGIAGISVAYELKKRGQRVALVESGRIVEAATGNTTAKVTSLHGLKYAQLMKTFTEEGARLYGEANEAAIDRIEELITEHNIDCDFKRLAAYTYAQNETDRDKVKEEAEAAAHLGLPASYVEDTPLPYPTFGAVMFTNQAHFHVRKYLLAIAEMIDGNGSCILENTTAIDVTTEDDHCKLVTDKGTITANDVVVATHEPFYDPDGDYKDLFSFRDYALGLLVKEETPVGEFFSTGKEPHSIRYHPTDKGDIIIVGGKSEEEMKAETPEEAYLLVEKDYSQKFAIERVVYQWYTYDLGTNDGSSYIGQLSRNQKHVHVTTGFNGWGMTNGVVSGMILADTITGKPNKWADFFDPFKRQNYKLKT